MGIGETVADRLAGHGLRAGDLDDVPRLRRTLRMLQERKRSELSDALARLCDVADARLERSMLEDPGVVDRFVEATRPLVVAGVLAEDDVLTRRLAEGGTVIFEGAQGVLLDEWHGFHPHTTWSTCTFARALELLEGFGGQVVRLGVLRSYAVRHGAGPFPTEQSRLAAALPERHNTDGPWQGPVRVGLPDRVLLRYALDVVGGVDALALTHLDALPRVADWHAAEAYDLPSTPSSGVDTAPGDPRRVVRLHVAAAPDLAHQGALAALLREARPVLVPIPGEAEGRIRWVEGVGQAPVALASFGPSAGDVRRRGALV